MSVMSVQGHHWAPSCRSTSHRLALFQVTTAKNVVMRVRLQMILMYSILASAIGRYNAQNVMTDIISINQSMRIFQERALMTEIVGNTGGVRKLRYDEHVRLYQHQWVPFQPRCWDGGPRHTMLICWAGHAWKCLGHQVPASLYNIPSFKRDLRYSCFRVSLQAIACNDTLKQFSAAYWTVLSCMASFQGDVDNFTNTERYFDQLLALV